MQPLALYIHWPFCKSKCPYCDFNSHVREGVDHDAWQTALLQEMDHLAAHMPNHSLNSIFFGGGTPSLMQPATVAALIDRATHLWSASENIEITLEANPTSVEVQKLRDIATAGVNRVSLGVQSLRADALAFLGREHSAGEALHAIEQAANLFDRYSFDLIYARPDQTAHEWETELREGLRYASGHLSLYQLTIEEGTAFHHAYHHKGMFNLPPEEESSDLYEATQAIMEDAGLPAYEISNHAAIRQESRHNMAYWQGAPYVGIGPGAHGRLLLDTGQWVATQMTKSPERWLQQVQTQGHGIEQWLTLDTAERAEEYLLMGLRIRDGIDLTRFDLNKRLQPATIQQLTRYGLVETAGNRLRATPKGWLLLNQVIAELLV